MFPPVDPDQSLWELPDPLTAEDDFVGVGADLEPGTLLQAYKKGLFPMPFDVDKSLLAPGQLPIGWWSPDPRGVLPFDGMKVSRSLRRSCRNFEIRYDTAFGDVIDACADPDRPHGWIDQTIKDAYTRLHQMGWAHSVEAWKDDTLVGGLYGVSINGLFAGESMFSDERDASKVALVALVERLQKRGFTLLDVQWRTDHLSSLGVVDVGRAEYLQRLSAALKVESLPFL